MAYFQTLERSRRIRMFLDEYYFGHRNIFNAIRLFGGPVLICIGVILWLIPVSPGKIAFATAVIFYGSYYTLKPWLWIIIRDDNFKTIRVNIEINDRHIRLVEDTAEAEIELSSLRRILKRKNYYMLELARYTKMYVPFNLLTHGQCLTLDQQLAGQAEEE